MEPKNACHTGWVKHYVDSLTVQLLEFVRVATRGNGYCLIQYYTKAPADLGSSEGDVQLPAAQLATHSEPELSEGVK